MLAGIVVLVIIGAGIVGTCTAQSTLERVMCIVLVFSFVCTALLLAAN